MTFCYHWGPAASAFCLLWALSLVATAAPAQDIPNTPEPNAPDEEEKGSALPQRPELTPPVSPDSTTEAEAAPARDIPETRPSKTPEIPAEPAQAPAPTPAPMPDVSGPTRALVHLYVDYEDAWLELRGAVDPEGWQAVCRSPCDKVLVVDGKVARVKAPGMTPSNVFRIEPGTGTVNIKVSGGSAALRLWGIIALAAGVPVTLVGAGLYGYGSATDTDRLSTAGIATLSVGGASIVAAVPLLLAGSTRVRDGRGKFIAEAASGTYRF